MFCHDLIFLCLQVNGPFVVNQLTGVITLARVLDYDVARSYAINIRAQVHMSYISECIKAVYLVALSPGSLSFYRQTKGAWGQS